MQAASLGKTGRQIFKKNPPLAKQFATSFINLEVEIELVSAGLNHAGNMFEKMEKKENEFERRVSTTMNSDAFQTLKQIYDANMFVQKATHEDDEIVSDYVFSKTFC